MSSSAGTIAELNALIANRPLLRRVYDPERDVGRAFVITGRPADWAEGARMLREQSQRLLAYHDRFWMARRFVRAGRPILPGRWPFDLGAHWLFAGQVRKRFFDAAPASINRCSWLTPLPPWRQAGRHDPSLLAEHAAALGAVFSRLHDAHSKQTYASLLRGRLEGDAGFFDVAPYAEYAHAHVRARPGDVVLDVGAFTGDSARRFAWQLRGFGRIVALEPDQDSFAKLARLRLPGLVALNVGAWHERATLAFNPDAGSSKLSETGTTQVEVRAIDEIVAEQGLKRVDLIKLDVESAEQQALDGARRTLSRFRPKLQVSIYHRPNDLFELPLRLMNELPDYRFYLGHHGPWHTETDLYAMPQERLR
jgi:FkbM family methyltransferase